MSFIIIEVESDGPIPAEFSMVCFGAVIFDDLLDKTFYGRTRPIADRFVGAIQQRFIPRLRHLRTILQGKDKA